MIKYIIEFPKEHDNDNVKFLYPFISSEILSMSNDKVLNLFFEEKFHFDNIGLQESVILDPESSEFKGLNSNATNFHQNIASNVEKTHPFKMDEPGNSFSNIFPQNKFDSQKPKSEGYQYDFPNELNQNQNLERGAFGLNNYIPQGVLKENFYKNPGMIYDTKRDSFGPQNPGSKVMQKICQEDIPENIQLNVNLNFNQLNEGKKSVQIYPKNQMYGDNFNINPFSENKSQMYFLNSEPYSIQKNTYPENNPDNLDLKDVLFEFLNNTTCLNSVLAGYFGKVVKSMILYKRKEIFEYLIESKKVQHLMFHIYNESIYEIIKALLKKIDNSSENTKVLKHQSLIFENLINHFSNSSLSAVCFKSLASIIDQLLDLDNDFIDRLFSTEICNILYQFGFNDSNVYFDYSFLIISKLLKKVHDHFKTPFLKCDVNEFIKISHYYLPMIFDKYFNASSNPPLQLLEILSHLRNLRLIKLSIFLIG